VRNPGRPGGRRARSHRVLCAPADARRLRAVKIYTRTGDDGRTGLIGRGRVPKSSSRVEAYGCVDELNAVLGLARAADGDGWFSGELAELQSMLLSIGAELATVDPAALAKQPRIADADVTRLEQWIDRFDGELTPLRRFVLPGGAPLAAHLQVARTVCRRAERRLVSLAQVETVDPRIERFLNRLSDLLFVMARAANTRAGVRDVEWEGGG
jgi:cob(I)alamin adenosyltransferase